MNFLRILFFLVIFSLAFADCCSDDCCCEAQSMHIDVRHIEPKGIGYKDGYTTLELFLMPNCEWMCFYPFLDFRGHVFNDGKFAANGGIGGRYLSDCRVWGVNAYYDFRQTHHRNFNQVSFGIESIGLCWDFYANGYVVVGDRQSKTFDSTPYHFSGNYFLSTAKRDAALSGADAEIGYHFLCEPCWDIYLGAGPYYLNGKKTDDIWGGKARLFARVWDYITLEASTSYDSTFKWLGQGAVGLRFSFGGTFTPEQGGRGFCCSCEEAYVLRDRLVQNPHHNEIIPVKRNKSQKIATNPETGEPYFFIFVDNTSSSNGTFESPFPMLSQAEAAAKEGDIIYVFMGDGTARNMDRGITLKRRQFLLGSGVPHELVTTDGMIVIPAMTAAFPVISNLTSGGSGVVISSFNVVSGMHIDQTDGSGISGGPSPIFGSAVTRSKFTNINTSNTPNLAAIQIENLSRESFLIRENKITGTNPEMAGMTLSALGDAAFSLLMESNIVEVPKDGVSIVLSGQALALASVKLNSVTSTGASTNGLSLQTANLSRATISVAENTFAAAAANGLSLTATGESSISGDIFDNICQNSTVGLSIVATEDAPIFELNLQRNQFTGNTGFDFSAVMGGATSSAAILCLSLENNDATGMGYLFVNDNATAYFNLPVFANNQGTQTNDGPPPTTFPTCTP